jgi:SAM-dependent methyltransferase
MDRGKLRAAIEDAFTELALHPACEFHFISGPPLAARLGYTKEMLFGIPEWAVASFSGVGNPFLMGDMKPGETVLDIGCGSGMDALIAARQVGERGQVIGIDMTAAMIERAQQNIMSARASNARIEWGYAESMPLHDNSVDCVISNGVINLTPDKRDTIREVSRVLKPGGRLQIADVLVDVRIPDHALNLLHLWTHCVAGASHADDFTEILEECGFGEIEVSTCFDVFEGTKVESGARKFGALGANVRARLGVNPQS